MRRKGELALDYGFAPSVMAETELDPTGLTPFEFGCRISAANERMMRDSDVAIANLTPFRGIAADVGTAFEVGFMRALGKPVFGYTNVVRGYFERLTEDYYGGRCERQSDGYVRGPDGMMVENHMMVDNLMIDGAIDVSGGLLLRRDVPADAVYEDLSAYVDCLASARRLFEQTQNKTLLA
ncbi:nucleoside 2-deoxyribosyltransferase [Rhizobium sp. AC44/96]|nr:nucleoside 2-deoxyribosyltransferase [Rhizobium sp. AC44/96]